MVTLTNRHRTEAFILNLPPECGTFKHEHRSLDHNPQTGDVGIRIVERDLCTSLHLMPGETSRPLPDEVADMPEVKARGRFLAVSGEAAE